jgi:hypothetical protein
MSASIRQAVNPNLDKENVMATNRDSHHIADHLRLKDSAHPGMKVILTVIAALILGAVIYNIITVRSGYETPIVNSITGNTADTGADTSPGNTR